MYSNLIKFQLLVHYLIQPAYIVPIHEHFRGVKYTSARVAYKTHLLVKNYPCSLLILKIMNNRTAGYFHDFYYVYRTQHAASWKLFQQIYCAYVVALIIWRRMKRHLSFIFIFCLLYKNIQVYLNVTRLQFSQM